MLSLPSSSSPISRQKYDVFLSFRGEDTRKKFTDHLYSALKRNGIVTFKDDSRLEAGEEIKPELLTAIQQSWCSVIVFSQTYCFSSWCLDELAEIVEQRNKKGHKIFPIFYDVDPSDLRKQAGRVAEAFAKHERRYKKNIDKTKRWRTALTHVANIKGWHLSNRNESEFIGEIVKKISAKLCQTYPVVLAEELIGINSRLEELHSKINIGEDDVRIIGICGMGGIGKTTLARVVYTQMSPHFEGKSFLADVREVSVKCGLASLQKQLLSQILLEDDFNLFNVHEGSFMISHRLPHKKVLIVIDDVDNIQHLKWLVGRRDWFGLGSRIIITTRDEHLPRSYRVDDVYMPTTLNAKESFCLFRLKAFNSDTMPKKDFVELSEHVVKYAGGLPLALELLGSFLCGRDEAQWRSAIERLERDSNKEILDRLRISFDGLEETDKNIFLDIASFFNGEEKDFVTKILDGCGFFAGIGINRLIEKSLIKVICDKYLWMHDLLQEMGGKIVRQKCVDEPGKRCRLWEEKDVNHVLTNNVATEAVEGMIIENKSKQPNNTFTLKGDAFLKMKKLRLLKVFSLPNCEDLKYLPDELRLLEWYGYPFKSLPSGFKMDNLVALLLPYGRIQQLWKGNKPLNKLKFIDLKGSQNLIKTPDFAMAPNLESLILEDCTRIAHVHPSIVGLRKLKLLNLKSCKRLKCLPTKKIGMESLVKLILSGCSNLERFPEVDGGMECLVELYLDGTSIQELPSSIGHLSSLVLLNLKDCSNLVSLPSSIDGCKFLKSLDLSGCSKVETFPVNLQQLKVLEELDLSETAIRRPPVFIFQFKNLKVLSFNGCKGPPSKLRPNLPFPFNVLQKGSKDSIPLMLPPLSGLSSLTELDLIDCSLGEGAIPNDICCLSSLKRLDLSANNFLCLPENVTRLSKLSTLILSDCKRLESVPELQTSLETVMMDGCVSLQVFGKPSTRCNLFDKPLNLGKNFFRLVEKNNGLALMKRNLKVLAKSRPLVDICLPGSKIPDWFSHQSDKASIKITLTPHIRNDSQWMGVAFCCVFDFTFTDDDTCGEDEIMCKAIIYGINQREINHSGFLSGRKYRRVRVLKDNLWVRYWSRDLLYPLSLVEKCGETEYLLRINLEDQECDEIFESSIHCNRIHKVKCGVRLVYEKDLEQCSSSTSANFDDHGLTWNGGALIKRKRNIYEEQEVEPSDSDTAEATPQPKRLEKFIS